MKKWILALLTTTILGVALTAYAVSGPFPTWGERLSGAFKISSSGVGQILGASGNMEGNYFAPQMARFVYDVAVDGGGTGAHGTGVYLPAKAVITRGFYKIVTQFTDSGSGTVALSCEDANNIVSAVDITPHASGTYMETIAVGASTGFISSIAAKCQITATVATAAQTAGKLVGWLEYVIDP
jgi:hypothetical protein